MINILQNGYLVLTGNNVFDFFFSWVGFFAVAGWSFSLVIQLVMKMK